jgi:hypothetical protein
MTTEFETIAEYEGYDIEEAKLTYAARKDLPTSAFCGPDRSFPAQDAAHVRNGFARLAQNGGKLSPAVRKKIYLCLVRRAKKFGVEHDPKNYKYGHYVTESAKYEAETDKVIAWYLAELGIKQ